MKRWWIILNIFAICSVALFSFALYTFISFEIFKNDINRIEVDDIGPLKYTLKELSPAVLVTGIFFDEVPLAEQSIDGSDADIFMQDEVWKEYTLTQGLLEQGYIQSYLENDKIIFYVNNTQYKIIINKVTNFMEFSLTGYTKQIINTGSELEYNISDINGYKIKINLFDITNSQAYVQIKGFNPQINNQNNTYENLMQEEAIIVQNNTAGNQNNTELVPVEPLNKKLIIVLIAAIVSLFLVLIFVVIVYLRIIRLDKMKRLKKEKQEEAASLKPEIEEIKQEEVEDNAKLDELLNEGKRYLESGNIKNAEDVYKEIKTEYDPVKNKSYRPKIIQYYQDLMSERNKNNIKK
ncbi:MAG: hypothetical protein WC867_08255 [Candidatus Pacearchaeota archaeon]|jgi:hypothetical protein